MGQHNHHHHSHSHSRHKYNSKSKDNKRSNEVKEKVNKKEKSRSKSKSSSTSQNRQKEQKAKKRSSSQSTSSSQSKQNAKPSKSRHKQKQEKERKNSRSESRSHSKKKGENKRLDSQDLAKQIAKITEIKSKIIQEEFGYTNVDNPFSDKNLADQFIWKLNKNQMKQIQSDKTTEQIRQEIQDVKLKKQQRELEKEKLEEEKTRTQKEREEENYLEWVVKEEQFQDEINHLRSLIRIKLKRERPIDKIVKIFFMYKGKFPYGEDYRPIINDMIWFLKGVVKLENIQDIVQESKRQYQYYQKINSPDQDFWESIITQSQEQLDQIQQSLAKAQQPEQNASSAFNEFDSEIGELLFNKDEEGLKQLEKEIEQQIQDPQFAIVDYEYYQKVLHRLKIQKSFMILQRYKLNYLKNKSKLNKQALQLLKDNKMDLNEIDDQPHIETKEKPQKDEKPNKSDSKSQSESQSENESQSNESGEENDDQEQSSDQVDINKIQQEILDQQQKDIENEKLLKMAQQENVETIVIKDADNSSNQQSVVPIVSNDKQQVEVKTVKSILQHKSLAETEEKSQVANKQEIQDRSKNNLSMQDKDISQLKQQEQQQQSLQSQEKPRIQNQNKQIMKDKEPQQETIKEEKEQQKGKKVDQEQSSESSPSSKEDKQSSEEEEYSEDEEEEQKKQQKEKLQKRQKQRPKIQVEITNKQTNQVSKVMVNDPNEIEFDQDSKLKHDDNNKGQNKDAGDIEEEEEEEEAYLIKGQSQASQLNAPLSPRLIQDYELTEQQKQLITTLQDEASRILNRREAVFQELFQKAKDKLKAQEEKIKQNEQWQIKQADNEDIEGIDSYIQYFLEYQKQNQNAEDEEMMFEQEQHLTQDLNRSDRTLKKPQFFNKIKLGHDWNKYNQTHYDSDNPPPKIIMGYKFNIFYPELVQKHVTPEYQLVQLDDPQFLLIKFIAGPPYEDLCFKILNKEWDLYDKKGFRCIFSRGILHLHFNFKRYRYRR